VPHTAFFGTDPNYRGILQSEEWSLCIGAGVCHGILPDWQDLTLAVLNNCAGQSLTGDEFKELTKTGWGLDAWLQTAMNLLIKSKCPDPFSKYYDVLEAALYGPILAKAEAVNQKAAIIAALADPKKIKRMDVPGLLGFFESQFGTSSIMALAKWLQRLANHPNTPHSVLSFNADGLLDTLSKLLDIQQRIDAKDPFMPPDRFFRSLRASDPPPTTSEDTGRRIPIYHLHGCLVPQSPAKASRPGRESRENLIFPETTYGKISGHVFTWQQTVFLSHAQSHRILFVGLSMSDPNLRRWLAWCNENALEEHKSRKKRYATTTLPSKTSSTEDYFIGRNIWITERPKSDRIARTMEFSLAHLGARICWLNSWGDLPAVLDNLCPA
jgi:hypothetical protein